MTQSSVRIIGIDPGFDRLGVCILDKQGTTETLIHSSCITTSKKDTFEVRLAEIGEQLTTILTTYKPEELAIETLFFTTNQKTIITVAEVRGICIYLSHIHDVRIYEYSPPQIKVAVTGYGKATKEDVAIMVPKILKRQLDSKTLDDEIDAIAIALTHSAHRKTTTWK